MDGFLIITVTQIKQLKNSIDLKNGFGRREREH